MVRVSYWEPPASQLFLGKAKYELDQKITAFRPCISNLGPSKYKLDAKKYDNNCNPQQYFIEDDKN